MDLNVNVEETKVLLGILETSRYYWSEQILEETGSPPNRDNNPGYFQVVDLMIKLHNHLDKLP